MSPEEIEGRMNGVITDLGGGRSEAFLPSPAIQNHAAFLAWLPDGSLGCAWFGGTLEGKSDISIHVTRLIPGSDRWTAPSQVTDDPARSEQNPVLWVDDDGGLVLFHTSQVSGNQEGSEVKSRPLRLASESVTSGSSKTLPLPRGTFIRAPIARRGDGALLLPLFLCKAKHGAKWNGSHDTAALAISDDKGITWRVVHVPQSLGCVHMTIVPLGGSKMAAFFRRRQADFVYRTTSEDGGETWSVPEATDVPNNNSSINAIRLRDGRIALLCNPISTAYSKDRRASLYDELGEEDDRPDSDGGIEPIWGVPRAPLTLCFSSDDGRTFPVRKLVEEGPGTCLSNNSVDGQNKELSYPVLLEDQDGTLHLAFTFHRRAIKYVRLAPDWLKA
ncbi:exo-alpha-sialidase [Rhizobium sp. LC145]|uniref:sialidase family protein n=1 Tax=Rhizobium sp. LC145 TaxID=1120688 RepID=UPI000629F4B8|nr:exo-alpha-sialidase [Rhizobium sp. LC145]KKX33052.1 glycosyl hydrolase [Rhizobium sp. LC145]TKT55995.1 glycosyl hydrolase [Rhizobiaceae bacterium LC148]